MVDVVRPSAASVLALLGGFAGCTESPAAPSFAYVHAAIIAPNCATAGCHSTLTAQSGIDLSTVDAAYTFLRGKPCEGPDLPGAPAGLYVVPFDPVESPLMYLLRGDNAPQMPPDLPLPSVHVQAVESWIANGAVCD